MKHGTAAVIAALCMAGYLLVSACIQWAWEAKCGHATVSTTPVYTPGTADKIAVLLPAGTPCRAEATVGDTWQAIEYMVDGRTYTGMVRTGTIAEQ